MYTYIYIYIDICFADTVDSYSGLPKTSLLVPQLAACLRSFFCVRLLRTCLARGVAPMASAESRGPKNDM